MLVALALAIPHKSVEAFSGNAGSGDSGKLYLKYKPYLKVEDGCVEHISSCPS